MGVEVIEFIDGSVAPVNVHVSALTLLNLQNEGIIGKKFIQGLVNQKEDEPVDIPLDVLVQCVYVAYRNANPKDYISYDDFLPNYEFSMDVGLEIYSGILTLEGKKAFSKNFIKKTASGNGKK